MTSTIFDKSPITKQLERAQRQLERYRQQEEEATANKPKFNLGRWFERNLMEIAVHIPVGVAIGISCYGWEQYGAFAFGLVPLTCALSYLLSRTYSLFLGAHRLDVAIFLPVLGALAFCTEAYGVHLGLERFNHANAAQGLQTFDNTILILVSVMLGLMNVFSRHAFITGHDKVSGENLKAESRWFRIKRENKGFDAIARTEQKEELAHGMTTKDRLAVKCYQNRGGWPEGYKPTQAALDAVAA